MTGYANLHWCAHKSTSRFVLPPNWDLKHLRVCVCVSVNAAFPLRVGSLCGHPHHRFLHGVCECVQITNIKERVGHMFFHIRNHSVGGYNNVMHRSFLAARRTLATCRDDFITLTDWKGWCWFNRGFSACAHCRGCGSIPEFTCLHIKHDDIRISAGNK